MNFLESDLLLEIRELAAKLLSLTAVPCDSCANVRLCIGRIAQLLANEVTVSVFELGESGIIPALVTYLRADGFAEQSRARLTILCQIFDDASAAICGDVDPSGHALPPPLAVLISKLHACVKSQERLPVHLNEMAGGTAEGLQMLSQPFKLKLQRSKAETVLRDYSHNIVLIEPLASINAVDDFLQTKVREDYVSMFANLEKRAASTGGQRRLPSAECMP
eukprot:SAG11_NODE_857_length_6851_cov_2.438981_2_plen_221_part_00